MKYIHFVSVKNFGIITKPNQIKQNKRSKPKKTTPTKQMKRMEEKGIIQPKMLISQYETHLE